MVDETFGILKLTDPVALEATVNETEASVGLVLKSDTLFELKPVFKIVPSQLEIVNLTVIGPLVKFDTRIQGIVIEKYINFVLKS